VNKLLENYTSQFNKNTLTIGLLSLGIGAALLVANERFAYNALFGPFPISGSELAQVKKPNSLRKYFVVVQGQAAFDTGIAWVKTKKRRGSSETSSTDDSAELKESEYAKAKEHLDLLLVDGYLLPIKVAKALDGPVLVGELGELEPDVTTLLRESLTNSKLLPRLLPLQLEQSSSFKAVFWTLCLLLAFLFLAGLLKLLQVLVFWKEPENHPLGKAIAKLGSYNTIRLAIDEDFAHNGAALASGKVTIGKTWLLLTQNSKPTFINLRDLVWVYGTSEKKTTMFIPSTSYSAMLCTADGKELSVPLSNQETAVLIQALAERAPWIQAGFDGKLVMRWNAHKSTVIAEVAAKRDQYLSGGS